MNYKISKKLQDMLIDFSSHTCKYDSFTDIPKKFYDDIEKLAAVITLKTKCENPVLYMLACKLQDKLCIGGIWKYDHMCRAEIIRYLSKEV